jgi:hypothetical protein
MYTAYGISANCNTFLLGFAILFGNETKEGWELYLRFLKHHHPSLDNTLTTFISDQGKGLIYAIQNVFPQVGHFHCEWHRRNNIVKVLKGGSTKYSGLWLYNQCMKANTIEQLDKIKYENAAFVCEKSLKYLNSIPDTSQYPAARVAMGNEDSPIYMYQRTSSSAAESMNKANMRARERTATDILCSADLLIKMSCARYNKHMDRVWAWNEFLTPHGKKLRDECLKNVNFRDYVITVTETAENRWNCTVAYRDYREKHCYFVNNPYFPSLFGGCDCRVPEIDGVPCHHMIAVVKCGRIDGLTADNAMPAWWTTAVWQQQYPKNSGVLFDFDLRSMKNKSTGDTTLHYCPDLANTNKSGRPKSNKRKKSILEEIRKPKSKPKSDGK